ncbi:MAG: hypothetical protein WD830_08965 [Chloroflexota bacterium]
MSQPDDEETNEHGAQPPAAPADSGDDADLSGTPPPLPPVLAAPPGQAMPLAAPVSMVPPPEQVEPAPLEPAAPVAPAPPAAPATRVDDSPTTEHAIAPIAPAQAAQPGQGWQQPGQWQQPGAQPPTGQWQQPGSAQPGGQWQQPGAQPPPGQWQGSAQYPPQQGYVQQPGYPQPGYGQPGYPPQGYPQQQYWPQQGQMYSTSALVAVAGLLLAVYGLIDIVSGVFLLGQGNEIRSFIQRTTINLFGTIIDRETMRALASPLPGVLLVFGALELILGAGIFAHKGWARALGILLSLVGLLLGVAAVSFALALAPGFSPTLIGAIVVMLGYAFILLALFAGGGHFRRRYPQR